MKISTRTRYGIRAAVELGNQYEKGPLQLRVIAKRQGISVKYLEQLMAVLRSSGLVRSLRGAKGGYILAKKPEEITILDVFHCLEGPTSTTECVVDCDACNQSLDCVTRQVWLDVEQAINQVLGKVTLADLVERAKSMMRQDYQI